MSEKQLGKRAFSNQSRLDFTVFEDSKGVRQTTIDFCLKQLGKAERDQEEGSKQ